jgi:hypothetical protein
MKLEIKEMNEKLLDEMESLDLIVRLYPSRESHRVFPAPGTGEGTFLYRSDERYGAHGLMAAAIDNTEFVNFGTHPDHEDILLLGGIGEKALFFLFAKDKRKVYLKKLYSGALTPDDFICFRAEYNRPYLSFFTVKKEVPHGECVRGKGKPATFYCTESTNLPLDLIQTIDLEQVPLRSVL